MLCIRDFMNYYIWANLSFTKQNFKLWALFCALWSLDIRIKILNNIYTNFKCLCIKYQIRYKNLMRHFFKTVISRILKNNVWYWQLNYFQGSEPMTSVFHSHALSKWDIRPWVYLVFIANMYRYFNFSFFFCVQISFSF